jgi:uncharacterized protein DUF4339
MSQWYFARDGKKQGPVTLDQLKGMAASGLLNQKDMILEDGSGKWSQAGSVQGLFDMPQPVATPMAEATVPAAITDVLPVNPVPPPVPQTASWYYAKDGQQYGPLEEPQLLAFLSSGQLLPTDLAWKAGTPSWIPLRQAFPFPPPLPSAGVAVAPGTPLTPDEWLTKRIGTKSPVAQSIVLGAVPVVISLIWLMLTPSKLYLGWVILSVLLFIGAAIAGGIGAAIQSSKGRPLWAGVRLGLFWYDAVVGLLFIVWAVLSVVCGVSFGLFQATSGR